MERKILSLTLLMMVSCVIFAQEKKDVKGTIGITFSGIGSNDVINASGGLIGGPGYDGDGFYSIGVSYVYPISTRFDIESGIEFAEHSITITPAPGIDKAPYNSDLSLITIPITARLNFLNYFFINGGLMLDFDTGLSSAIDSQSGIGSLIGLGAKHSLNNGFGAFVNAYYKSHSLIPISAESKNHRDMLLEAGLRIGLTYSF